MATSRCLCFLPCGRSEGTLAYFFSTQAIAGLAQAAGFETVECEYARVQVGPGGTLCVFACALV